MRQDFVITRELLHLRIPTLRCLFKALMSVYLPGWQEFKHEVISSYRATTRASVPPKVPRAARLAKYSFSIRSDHASHGVP